MNLRVSIQLCGLLRWSYLLEQCFSTAGPRHGTVPWHQLYRAAKGSPGICHFSFLSIFREYIFYSGNILKGIIIVNVSKSYNTTTCYKISLVQWFITNLNVILYLSTCHTVYISVLILYDYAIINFNTYVSFMYELKKNEKIFTSKCVGTGLSSYEKRIYRAAVSRRLRNTVLGGG